MLHVTSWEMAGVRTDAQQWQWRRVQKKHFFQATCRQLHREPSDENAPKIRKKTLISKAWIYIKTQRPKTQVLDTWRKEFDQIPCRYEVAIRMALPIQKTHSSAN